MLLRLDHDAAPGWRPAAWTLNNTCDTRKELKKAEYNVGTGKAAARVVLEHQEAMNAALAACYQLHNPKPEVQLGSFACWCSLCIPVLFLHTIVLSAGLSDESALCLHASAFCVC